MTRIFSFGFVSSNNNQTYFDAKNKVKLFSFKYMFDYKLNTLIKFNLINNETEVYLMKVINPQQFSGWIFPQIYPEKI